jgi:hypothetical protein
VGGGGAVCYLCVCVLCTELKDPFGNHADTSTYVKRRSDCTLMLRVLFSLFTFSFFFFPGRRIITERKKRWKKIFSSFFFFFVNQPGDDDDGPSVSCSAVHRVVMSFFFLLSPLIMATY